ncbi:MAG: Rad52/Rad22 family DNA repair protein [Candidatus Micrarchaeia archaeon]
MIREKVRKINEILEKYGDEAIQEEKRPWGSLWGYKPQYLIDAVNEVLGEENWGFKLVSLTTTPGDNGRITAVAQVEVYIKIGDELVCKGPQFGVSTNYPGDAEKGAITDALGKGLSLWGIGSKAYRGLLRPTAQNSPSPEVPKESPQPQEVPKETPNLNSLKPSKPQLVLIRKLAQEKGVEVPEVSSKEEASKIIKELMALPKK